MNRLILLVMAAVVTGAMVAGFAVVGGPAQARKERHDIDRGTDLRALFAFLECKRADQPLPQTLDDDAYCVGNFDRPETKDPATQESYLYRRIDDRHFEVCATFATWPDKHGDSFRFRGIRMDGNLGCLAGMTRHDP